MMNEKKQIVKQHVNCCKYIWLAVFHWYKTWFSFFYYLKFYKHFLTEKNIENKKNSLILSSRWREKGVFRTEVVPARNSLPQDYVGGTLANNIVLEFS